MCSHYQAVKQAERLRKHFDAHRPEVELPADMWPRYQGLFIRRPVEWDSGDDAVPTREAVAGRWGLISAMVRPDGLEKAGKLSTFNARSETAAKSYTFGNAWRRGQHCIVPAEAVYGPSWRRATPGGSWCGMLTGDSPKLLYFFTPCNLCQTSARWRIGARYSVRSLPKFFP